MGLSNLFSWMTGHPPKDPMDWGKTITSTHWEPEKACPICLETVDVYARLANICPFCGSFVNSLAWKSRVRRNIWNGKKWVTQLKYGNGPNDYTIDGKKPTSEEVGNG